MYINLSEIFVNCYVILLNRLDGHTVITTINRVKYIPYTVGDRSCIIRDRSCFRIVRVVCQQKTQENL